MSSHKRQHYVPVVYLSRFTHRGQLYVRPRETPPYTTGPHNVALECGFYDINTDTGSTSKVVEHLLSDIEDMVGPVLEHIDRSGNPPQPLTHDREVLSAYLALQFTRTPEHRERVLYPERLAEFLAERKLSKDLVAEYLHQVHLGFRPSVQEIQGAFDYAAIVLGQQGDLTPRLAIDLMFRGAEQLAPVVDALHWTIEYDRKARFITSDSPLVPWRRPSWRDQYEGVGVARRARSGFRSIRPSNS